MEMTTCSSRICQQEEQCDDCWMVDHLKECDGCDHYEHPKDEVTELLSAIDSTELPTTEQLLASQSKEK